MGKLFHTRVLWYHLSKNEAVFILSQVVKVIRADMYKQGEVD